MILLDISSHKSIVRFIKVYLGISGKDIESQCAFLDFDANEVNI